MIDCSIPTYSSNDLSTASLLRRRRLFDDFATLRGKTSIQYMTVQHGTSSGQKTVPVLSR